MRAERGLTLREAASVTSVAKETISDIERGLRHPHDPTLAKIAKGYGVPVEELLEEPVPAGKAEAPEEVGRLDEKQLEADGPKNGQHWDRVLASVRKRQQDVEVRVEELAAISAPSRADLYQVKWALDEAQDCEVALMLAVPGSHKQRRRGREEIALNPLTIDLDQWEELANAERFYVGIVERLVEVGLVERKERAGQKPEAVPVGIGG